MAEIKGPASKSRSIAAARAVALTYGAGAVSIGAYFILYEYLHVSAVVLMSSFGVLCGIVLFWVGVANPGGVLSVLVPGNRVGEEILSEVGAADRLARRPSAVESDKVASSRKRSAEPDYSTAASIFSLFRDRMTKEVFRLQSAADKNLVLGVIFCVLGAGVLITFTYFPAARGAGSANDEWNLLASKVIPRLLTGLVISSAGFFFLRLYMSNEMDIKHTKNEVTNIESRMIALNAFVELVWEEEDQLSVESVNSLSTVLKSFSVVERNFATARGRATVSHEGIDKLSESLDVVSLILEKLPWSATAAADASRSGPRPHAPRQRAAKAA